MEEKQGEMIPLLKTTFLVIGLLGWTTFVTSDPNTGVKQVLCNSGVYAQGDPFAASLAYVVQELEAETPSRKGYDYYNISPYPDAFAYGHSTCSFNLTSTDCSACLTAAKAAMFGTCQSRIGARSVLYDCSIRYEQYPFVD